MNFLPAEFEGAGLWRPRFMGTGLRGGCAPLVGGTMGEYGRGEGWVRLARVGGGLEGKGGICKEWGEPMASGELLPEVIMPFWEKKRFRESQREVKSVGSRAQSQSSAWRMLSSRSGNRKWGSGSWASSSRWEGVHLVACCENGLAGLKWWLTQVMRN